MVHEATGLAYSTIKKGISELTESQLEKTKNGSIRVRQKGGGRKKAIDTDTLLKQDIENLVEASTRGDPEAPLLWCSKSTRKITKELNELPHRLKRVSHVLVARTLANLGYSLQANRKVNEGGKHADRDEQFKFINSKVKDFQAKQQPVISVDVGLSLKRDNLDFT